MQCRRCGFENMPGITTCMRCNSALVAEKINVHPPRAGWRKPFRPLFYVRNRIVSRFSTVFAPINLGIQSTKSMHGIFLAALSIIPGLGHLISGQWRALLWQWPAWAASTAASAFFFGSEITGFFVGLMIALHVWIICDAGKLRKLFAAFTSRLVFVLAFCVLVILFYAGLRTVIERDWIFGVTIPFDLPADGLRGRDFVYFRRHPYERDKPRRGDILHYNIQGRPGPESVSVGKVFGLPREHIKAKAGKLTVTAPDGTITVYNIRACDVLFPIDLTLQETEYWCLPIGMSMGQGGEQMGQRQMLGMTYDQMGRVTPAWINGRGWAVYHPLWEHEWMRHQPLPALPAPAADPDQAL